MAIKYIEEKRKRQKYLIAVFVIVVIAIICVFWFGYYKKPEKSAPSGPKVYYQKIKVDFSVLDNPLLKEMEIPEKIKPFEGKKGRENPFSPF